MHKNFLAFLVGAITMASTLVACDRTSPEEQSASEPAADQRQAQQQEQQPTRARQPSASAAPSASSLPPREALADTVITGKIKAAILGDPAMQGADVSVNTDRGVVTLAGLVKTPEQTAIASAHAQRQDGVMRVDNHLSPARQ